MSKRSERPKVPSMKDVAKLAGVSQTTVSFVMNQVEEGNIPQGTQERVWDAINELGYRPNAIARGLRAQQTQTIGFISDEIASTPFAGEIIRGAQDTAWREGKLILLINTGRDKRMKGLAVDTMLDRQVDGIIYATMYHREVDPPQAVYQIPAVLLDCFVADRSLPSVVPNEIDGGYSATVALIRGGHHRIGYLSNQDSIPATFGRLQGYRKALSDHNLPIDEKLIWAGPSDTLGGYAGTMSVLQQMDRPTALFCFNDRMAMGAYQAASELNLSIPNDIAVVGFDNQEVISAWLRPSLTTVELPHYEMGRWAVEHLLELIKNPQQGKEASTIQHLVECTLIERASI